MPLFPPEYHRALRAAVVCQVIGFILAALVLDFGFFAFRFLCLSLAFWMFVGIFAFVRRRPSIIERIAIGGGPMLIFWTMFFIG
jgi:hypothetical protein